MCNNETSLSNVISYSLQSAASQENDRRTYAAYTAAGKHRPPPQTHYVEKKDSRPNSASSAGAPHPPAPAPAPPAAPEPRRDSRVEGTLTAASLIDAIITHQISQTSTDTRFPPMSRECDNGAPPPPTDRPERPPPERDELLPQHTTSIKLGDLASNIITRDFCSPTHASLIQHNNRRPLASEKLFPHGEAKHAPYLEPVSPPDNHHANRNSSSSSNRGRYGGGGAGAGGGLIDSAYHYVTTRIVEVMRGDDERHLAPDPLPANTYAYPYSALNVSAPTQNSVVAIDGGSSNSGHAPAPPPPVAPEPAPLMSAQYESVSDED
ncbi:unnamed protein product [Plutella xylostella]|uniref:(diamondback moth) hypothetical protein n=1 Tax=Plutella xylostella TaxID=51655 RepID=A0A8S4FCC6_PLUXY|nr:unnamed protein product [Plutella xylostella]